MAQDKLWNHRDASRRENPNNFGNWLAANCTTAIDAKKLREATKGKEAQIKKVLKNSP